MPILRQVELRHTGATLASHERGFDVQDLMAAGGWSSPQIPLMVYVKRSTKAAARKMAEVRLAPEEGEVRVVDRESWRNPRRGEP